MTLAEAHPSPAKLWLAATPPHGDNEPDDEAQRPDLAQQSLRVLIVEDEFFISLHTKDLLHALGHTVVAIAVSADEAVSIAEQEGADVVLMDIRLIGPRDGIDAAEEIYRRFGISSVFVTANTDVQTRRRAASVQPLGFLEKPLTEERLKTGLSGIVPKL